MSDILKEKFGFTTIQYINQEEETKFDFKYQEVQNFEVYQISIKGDTHEISITDEDELEDDMLKQFINKEMVPFNKSPYILTVKDVSVK